LRDVLIKYFAAVQVDMVISSVAGAPTATSVARLAAFGHVAAPALQL
jgi:hypothetical protein